VSENIVKDGIPLEPVEVTTVEILPGQAAVVIYQDGVTLVAPKEKDEDAFVPQHVLFAIGVYIKSADPVFVETMVRFAINELENAKKLDD